MKNIFTRINYHKIIVLITKHKIISAVVAVAIVFSGYQIIKSFTATSTQTKYVISAVQKGTVVSTISGTGQVSASSQIDLKSKASGNLLYIGLSDGQEIKEGTLIAQIDSRDARISLQNARLSLAKITQAADVSTITQSQNSLEDAIDANKKANDTLSTSYASALNSISSTFIDFPAIIDGMNTLFYTQNGTLNDVDSVNLPSEAKQYKNDAGSDFDLAKVKYLTNIATYKSINQNSSTSSIENLIDETLSTTRLLTQSVKNAKNTVDYTQNQGGSQFLKNISLTQTNLNSWLSKLSAHLDELTSISNTIQNSKISITSSARDIIVKKQTLEKLQNGADPLDIQQQQLAVQSQEYNYDNYFIRAPFDGVIAKTNVNKGDSISSGTTIATFITKQKIASITLNEVDVAKVKIGDKATLTFDAVDSLSITGKVLEVDLAGVVSQGVVTYGVKIGFDTQDDRVRSGMTVSVSIATEVHQDVLVVPNGAIKTKNGSSYVEVVNNDTPTNDTLSAVILPTTPTQKPVTIGISDDQNTEVVSGLNEGEKIVSKTVIGTSAIAAQAPSLLNAVGGNRGTNGSTRALGR